MELGGVLAERGAERARSLTNAELAEKSVQLTGGRRRAAEAEKPAELKLLTSSKIKGTGARVRRHIRHARPEVINL